MDAEHVEESAVALWTLPGSGKAQGRHWEVWAGLRGCTPPGHEAWAHPSRGLSHTRKQNVQVPLHRDLKVFLLVSGSSLHRKFYQPLPKDHNPVPFGWETLSGQADDLWEGWRSL